MPRAPSAFPFPCQSGFHPGGPEGNLTKKQQGDIQPGKAAVVENLIWIVPIIDELRISDS